MDNFQAFIEAAEWLHAKEWALHALCRTDTIPEDTVLQAFLANECGVRSDNPAVIRRCIENGIPADRLFAGISSCSDADFSDLWGHCSFVAETKQDIARIDPIAPRFLKPGYLEPIAFSLLRTGDTDSFTEENIPQFSKWIRFSQSLAARGIFTDCSHDEGSTAADYAETAKARFSLIKKIRSDMPCLFSSFCFCGLLEPLTKGDEELTKTVEMLASLNDTSFYARFFIQ